MNARSGRCLRAATVGLLIIGASVAVAAPAANATTVLSSGCQSLKNADSVTISAATGAVTLSFSFNAGETILIDPQFGDSWTYVVNGQTNHVDLGSLYYSIGTTGGYNFVLTRDGSSSSSWMFTCGVAPEVSLTPPAGGPTYTYGEVVPTTFSCTADTYPLQFCADSNGQTDGTGALDTSSIGPKTYFVGASDTKGFSRAATYSYNVIKATPTLTWGDPAAIAYPTPLSATQLDATASVPGSFAYSPAAGPIVSSKR